MTLTALLGSGECDIGTHVLGRNGVFPLWRLDTICGLSGTGVPLHPTVPSTVPQRFHFALS